MPYKRKEPTLRNCKNCGKEFLAATDNRLYCDYKCRYDSRDKPQTYDRECDGCGKEFTTGYKRQSYCSRDCRLECNRQKAADVAREYRGEIDNCLSCGNMITGNGKKYCSNSCHLRDMNNHRQPYDVPTSKLDSDELGVIQLIWQALDYAPLSSFGDRRDLAEIYQSLKSHNLFYQWVVYTIIFQSHLAYRYETVSELPEMDKEAYLRLCNKFNVVLMDSDKFVSDMGALIYG